MELRKKVKRVSNDLFYSKITILYFILLSLFLATDIGQRALARGSRDDNSPDMEKGMH
jgi:hypothetical protein